MKDLAAIRSCRMSLAYLRTNVSCVFEFFRVCLWAVVYVCELGSV